VVLSTWDRGLLPRVLAGQLFCFYDTPFPNLIKFLLQMFQVPSLCAFFFKILFIYSRKCVHACAWARGGAEEEGETHSLLSMEPGHVGLHCKTLRS